MDNDPKVMVKKIDAAADNGVDHFIFDWYWYNETGGVFQDGALEDGFLKAPNRHRLEFSLMWASQVWMNVHPAVGPTVPYNRRSPQFSKFDPPTFDAMTTYIVDKYFSQPNYQRVQLRPGAPKCLFWSIYEPSTFINGMGSTKAARAALDAFRTKAEKAGLGCLHLNTMDGEGLGPKDIAALGFDSASSYCWYKSSGALANNFPVAPYEKMLDESVAQWHTVMKKFGNATPYIPNLSVQWDPSPRCVQSDTFAPQGLTKIPDNYVYPFTSTFVSTPQQWRAALEAGKAFLDKTCAGAGSTWCPITINAWNEWSEGSYLEPDRRYGMQKLQAIGEVFGSAPNRSQTAVVRTEANPGARKVKVGAIRWDGYFTEAGVSGAVGAFNAKAMSQPMFQWHLPFYAQPITDMGRAPGSSRDTLSVTDNIPINDPDEFVSTAPQLFSVNITPAAMEKEIAYAADNGIDYFAFDMYPTTCGNWSCADQYPQNPVCQDPRYGNGDGCYQCCAANWMMSRALKYFLSSPSSSQMQWAMIIQNQWLAACAGPGTGACSGSGSSLTVKQEVQQYLNYIRDPRYLRTDAQSGSRPVVFIFNSAAFGSATDPAGAELIALNATAHEAGLPPLYFIGQVFSASEIDRVAFPVDAFSTYGLSGAGTPGGEPFSAHAAREAALWESMASNGRTVVPTFTPFWDSRPMNAGCCAVDEAARLPCPWCPPCSQGVVKNATACMLSGAHTQRPAPGEAATQTRRMLEWIAKNKHASDVGLGLISAWNENVEGHFVVPHWTAAGDNSTLLREIGTVLKSKN